MSGFRMSAGGFVDRSRKLTFTFDGETYEGHPGDTLASALLANDVRVVGRSFKYHRPRGLWGAWFDEPNAIFDVSLGAASLTNCPASMTLLEAGMHARAVNATPTASRDIKGVLDKASRFLSAGFYYKTFMWPDWHLFEPIIRKMAGLGHLDPREIEGYQSDQRNDQCDLLVGGGGPAGLGAAMQAAEAGQDVVLVDDQPNLGGTAWQYDEIEGKSSAVWVEEHRTRLIAAGGRIFERTTAFGVYDHRMIALAQDHGFAKAPGLTRMRVRRCVLATGAIDRPMTFAMNDVPGVMSLNGALEYLARYGVLAGREIAVMAPHGLAEISVSRLRAAGAQVTTITDLDVTPEALGRKSVRGLRTGRDIIACDTILTSAGLMPVLHLWSHAGGKLTWDDSAAAFVPGQGPDWMQALGAANGTFDLDDALAEASAAARNATTPPRKFTYSASPPVPQPNKKRQWIDLQHDVTFKDIELASRENYASVEHLKRYTTLGMASDQGKTSNVAGLSVMAKLRGKTIPEVGTTTFRPPFVPVPLELYRGAHRGEQFHPLKRLALEPEHREAGAALGEYGGWLRPAWYGLDKSCVADEVRMSRNAASILDSSPLGKIDVMGPDAEQFMNFVYYNTMRTLKPGRLRYGFLLTEGGIVFDDGVVSRLGPKRFTIFCSSSHGEAVTAALESWRQDGNDPDRIFIHDTTHQWATVTLAGPKAREIVTAMDLGANLSPDALPHMASTEGRFADAQVRINRVSFTGDVSFELSIASSKAAALWAAAVEIGKPLGAGPIGIEALSILRAEKGYIIVGRDTDGATMPHDLGFGAPRLKKTTAFVGDRALHTVEAKRADRKRLVGLTVSLGEGALPNGSHLIISTEGKRRSVGFVTSSYDSPTLGKPIALAQLEAAHAVEGETVEVFHLGETRTALVTSPCFYDPEGAQLNA